MHAKADMILFSKGDGAFRVRVTVCHRFISTMMFRMLGPPPLD